MVFTNHETRDTKHGFSLDTNHGLYRRAVRRGCDRFAQPTAAARAAAPVAQSLLSCSLLFAIVRHCSLINIALSQCPRTVCSSRQSSRRASFAAAPVALRAAAVAAIARWTHPEKGQRSGSHEQGSFLYCVGRKKSLTIGESQSRIRQHICTYRQHICTYRQHICTYRQHICTYRQHICTYAVCSSKSQSFILRRLGGFRSVLQPFTISVSGSAASRGAF